MPWKFSFGCTALELTRTPRDLNYRSTPRIKAASRRDAVRPLRGGLMSCSFASGGLRWRGGGYCTPPCHLMN